MTAALGILAGIGFYLPLVISVLLALGVLSVFRWIETRMPTEAYCHFEVRFVRAGGKAEQALRALIEEHGFSIADFSHRPDGEGHIRRYGVVLRTLDRANISRLADTLEADQTVLEFRIAPSGG